MERKKKKNNEKSLIIKYCFVFDSKVMNTIFLTKIN